MEFSKRKMIPAALAVGLGGVLLTNLTSGVGPGLPTRHGQEGKIQCTSRRQDEWLPVVGHLDPEQVKRVSEGLRISTERVERGRVGFADCDRPMTPLEEVQGMPIRLPDVKQGCFLLGNAVVIGVEPAAQVVCTALSTDRPQRHSF